MVILKKIMQNKKEADPDGAEGWDRKKKTGNISKIKGNQETSDRVYGRNWT